MTTLTIKDVPENWAQSLRERASRNHRSLQGELMAVLEQALNETPAQAQPALQAASVEPKGWKTIEQVVAELRSKYPQRIDSGPSSIELIRAERDGR